MQRNMDLVRQILIETEKRSVNSADYDVKIEGYSSEEIRYHVKIMHQAGLVEAVDRSHHGGLIWEPTSLTWEGHEFLDNIRNETVWAKTKSIVKDKGGSASLEIIKALVVKVATHYMMGS